jgi:hypothetical protein
MASSALGSVPDAKKPDPVLGVDCGECEDVVQTFTATYPCPDSDVSDGDGASSSDPGEDIHCTFKCTMLCTDDEESCIKRTKMCKTGHKGIDTSKSLFKYIWQTNTCGLDVIEACARLPKSLQLSLGFLPACTEQDYDILSSDACKENVNCEEAKNGNVDNGCFTCMWLFKSTPMFAGICEPGGLQTCNSFRDKVLNEEPIMKELYLDDVPDPWTMPPWGRWGKAGQAAGAAAGMLGGMGKSMFGLLRRRRRLLDSIDSTDSISDSSFDSVGSNSNSPGEPFTKDDERGIGSIPLRPLKKTKSWPGNCMKLWRQMELSDSGQTYSRRMSDDPQKACKCMCECPYTTNEWLELKPKCFDVVNNDEYLFNEEDTLGRECKEKQIKDQEHFEEEAENAAEEGEDGGAAASTKKKL